MFFFHVNKKHVAKYDCDLNFKGITKENNFRTSLINIS